jgi:DHA2 family metal-tetracycline-proton antiporter-like MFS transporter
MQTTQPSSFDPCTARRTLVLVSVAVLSSVLSSTMINIVLPLIGRDLNVEPARLGWLVTGYLLVFGISIPFYGRLADHLGARRLFVFGLCVFAIGSLLCVLASAYAWLLAGRLVQAVGSGAIPGLGVALVSRAYPPERRGSAMGFVSAAVGSGAAIGPTLGGFIAGALGWHSVFGVTALTGLLAPFAWRIIPRGSRRVQEPIDVIGGLLLALTVAGALLAATEASRGNPAPPIVLTAAGVAFVSTIGLVMRQRLAVAPFIPRDLLRNYRFVALVMLSLTAMGVNLPTLVSVPLLLSAFNQLSPVQVGLALLPEALVFTLLGPVAGRVVDRFGPRLPIRAGLSIMFVAIAALSAFGAGAHVWVVSVLAAVLGAGFAFVNAPLTTTISLLLPPARLSSGMSMNSMLYFLGGAFGTALLSAVLTARDNAESAINPVYTGQAIAFSDAYLVLLTLLLVAFGLTRALPERTHRTAEQQAGQSTPAGRAVRE